MNREEFLPLIRQLAECYQAFEAFSSAHIREMGLTPPQFDVLATLGNTEGMGCKRLGESTLITKGTLTGVVDRMEEKGLVARAPDPKDGRAQVVKLTKKGEEAFESAFPAHVARLSKAFDGTSAEELREAVRTLGKVKAWFEKGARDASPSGKVWMDR